MMKGVIITSAKLTRELLRQGEKIIDVKPHREVKNATVFVFQNTENIEKILEERRKGQSK